MEELYNRTSMVVDHPVGLTALTKYCDKQSAEVIKRVVVTEDDIVVEKN